MNPQLIMMITSALLAKGVKKNNLDKVFETFMNIHAGTMSKSPKHFDDLLDEAIREARNR